jgi:hypothetical protein
MMCLYSRGRLIFRKIWPYQAFLLRSSHQVFSLSAISGVSQVFTRMLSQKPRSRKVYFASCKQVGHERVRIVLSTSILNQGFSILGVPFAYTHHSCLTATYHFLEGGRGERI